MNEIKVSINSENRKRMAGRLYGIFLEDINYGVDGGIYADLLENRNFEAYRVFGAKDQCYPSVKDSAYAWGKMDGYPTMEFQIKEQDPLNRINPHYLQVGIKEEGAFFNQAYRGIFLRKGMNYQISFWAKIGQDPEDTSEQNTAGRVLIQIQDKKDGRILAQTEPVVIQKVKWTKYTLSLQSEVDSESSCFIVHIEGNLRIGFDQFSMMPEDAVCGLFRKDLFEKLKEMKPAFLRFPGGCVVEGANLQSRYNWKESVGPKEYRRSNWNRWALFNSETQSQMEGEFSHYNQTLAIGFYEYFLLSEALGAEPLPIMNVGVACQYQSKQVVDLQESEFRQYIQDVLDLIEFANGSEDSNWGRLRKEMGHPKPFGLKHIGIGNEQWQTEVVDYYERYKKFEEIVHANYPDIELIGSVGPDIGTERHADAWRYYREECGKKSDYTNMLDEHYYMPPKWFLEHVDFYDSYLRDIQVFAGEYAAHTTKRENSWESALAEAAFMTGLEKNADLVHWAAYAPLLARIGYAQWKPNLIWFDEKEVYATPNYYVQKLFSTNLGDHIIQIKQSSQEGIYTSCTWDETSGDYYIKVVNAENQKKQVIIEVASQKIQAAEAVFLQSDSLNATNENGAKEVVPRKESIRGNQGQIRLEALPYSVCCIKVSC